jgi:N-acetylmuramoyl-L-alanine amidase
MPSILIECCFCDSKKDMTQYDPDKMAAAIAIGLIGKLPDNENEPCKLKVKQSTWLKKSTNQAINLSENQKRWIKAGNYDLLCCSPKEEEHHLIKLTDDSEWFIFGEHVTVTSC